MVLIKNGGIIVMFLITFQVIRLEEYLYPWVFMTWFNYCVWDLSFRGII